jgi:uncharacterized protein involved in propanediol utilization
MKISLTTQDKFNILGVLIISLLLGWVVYSKGGIEPIAALIVSLGYLFTILFNGFLKSQKFEGIGEHYGTCGELVQGFLSEGKQFHVTCPINKTSSVKAHIRKDFTPKINYPDGFSKIKKAAELALKSLDKDWYSVDIERWSDLDIGKGMGSSTADIIATVKAIYSAFNAEVSEQILIDIATTIESSDGSMVDGMVAFNHKNGEIYHRFNYYPKFNIVIIIPESTYNTESIKFAGKELDSKKFEKIFNKLQKADIKNDIKLFAKCAMKSADLNLEYLPNKLIYQIRKDMKKNKKILGYCVGHTGNVCGALFMPNDAGRLSATKYAIELGQKLSNAKVEIVRIP